MPLSSRTLSSLVLLLVLLAACNRQTPPTARPPVEVGVAVLASESVALESQLPARTTASLVSDVRPQVSGIVKARRFEEGSTVEAGQVLYEIDPAPYQSAFDQAKADLAAAEATVGTAKLKDERYSQLLKIEGVSQQEADDARASYLQAVASVAQKKAALNAARIDLEFTRVRAPISGRIGTSSVTPGALVTANQEAALATIRALDPIYVDLTQSSAQLLKLRRLLGTEGMQAGGTQVRLKLEDGSEYPSVGTLKFQEVAVNEATGSVTLRALFPNPDGVLLPGMYVRAVLNEAVNTAAVLAPQQAVTRKPGGGAIALVVSEDNRVEERELVAERVVGNRWLVDRGLRSGDRVIVEGLNKVRAGDTVQPVAINARDNSSPAPSAETSTPVTASTGSR